jgi:hypothetical protein
MLFVKPDPPQSKQTLVVAPKTKNLNFENNLKKSKASY